MALLDDTLTILLTNSLHKHEPVKVRAGKIRKCAKYLHKRADDKAFKNALKRIRDTKDDLLVVKALDNTQKLHDGERIE